MRFPVCVDTFAFAKLICCEYPTLPVSYEVALYENATLPFPVEDKIL